MGDKRVSRYKPLFFNLILTYILITKSVCEENDGVCFKPMLKEDQHVKCPLNSLNGQHLRVIAVEAIGAILTKRNATGHVIEISGMGSEVMEALSQMLHFSYSYMPIVTTARSFMPFLEKKEADFVLGAIFAIAANNKLNDYTAAVYTAQYGILIPYPKVSLKYAAAVLTPLDVEVWVTIMASIAAVCIALYLFVRYRNRRNPMVSGTLAITNHMNHETNNGFSILNRILSQGGSCVYSRWIVVRILAGAWCLGCFFLIQLYCCTLTSHLTMPYRKVLVDSVYDIPNVTGLQITVDRGLAPELLIKFVNTGIIKQLGDMLRANPKLSCDKTADCLQKVQTGSYVYIQASGYLDKIIQEDLKSTGECHFSKAKETFWSFSTVLALQKNSPYTNLISQGILQLNDVGLIGKWYHDFYPKDTKCSRTNRNSRGKEPLIRLSLGHLSGAFVILLIGYLAAVLVLLGEHILAAYKRRKHLELIGYCMAYLIFIRELVISAYSRCKHLKIVLVRTKIKKQIKIKKEVKA